MKVVVIVGSFADTGHLRELAGETDTYVYGASYPGIFEKLVLPGDCTCRVFRPAIATQRGHQLWLYPGLSAALDEDQPDVIHVVSEAWGVLTAQAAQWARRNPRTAFVVHGMCRTWWHGSRTEVFAKRGLATRALSRADGFAGMTAKTIQIARTAGLSQNAPTEVIHAFPRSPELFRPPRDMAERTALRKQLALPVSGIGFAFLARFVPEKGPLLFLDAFKRAAPRLEKAWAVIAGAGPLSEAIENRARKEGVHFLGRLQFPDDVVGLHRAVDVMVVPSYSTKEVDDQSPRSAFEAMMSGRVVVGSDSGAIPEMIEGVGVVTKQRDVEGLARGMIKGAELAATGKVGPDARARAVVRYSTEAVTTAMLDLWRRARERRQVLS